MRATRSRALPTVLPTSTFTLSRRKSMAAVYLLHLADEILPRQIGRDCPLLRLNRRAARVGITRSVFRTHPGLRRENVRFSSSQCRPCGTDAHKNGDTDSQSPLEHSLPPKSELRPGADFGHRLRDHSDIRESLHTGREPVKAAAGAFSPPPGCRARPGYEGKVIGGQVQSPPSRPA